MSSTFWHDDWDAARVRLEGWWDGTECALSISALKKTPWAEIPTKPRPTDLEAAWTDPEVRVTESLNWLSRTWHGGAAYPFIDTEIGPGSLGLFMGCEPGFAPSTVWYEPCLTDLSQTLKLNKESRWWKVHLDLMKLAVERSEGRVLVGIPDLIENLDTLAQLRGPQELMEEILEEKDLAKERITEINQAFFQAFDDMATLTQDAWGGTCFAAFNVWGIGKVAKVQCDANTMISPELFKELVVPSLTEQCAWLDRAVFHLDGTQAMIHLPALLAVEPLEAIEWTPQTSLPQGGDPTWYPLYRRIKEAGKSVHAINVLPEQVMPMIRELGREGLFMIVQARDEDEGRDLVKQVYGRGR